MFHDILFLILGLILLVAGGNYVTDGAVAIAKKFNISSLIIGLTIVAFGSSVPDLVVCLVSTLKDKTQLAMGDIVGAGIFDMLLGVGVTTLVLPVKVSSITLKRNFPFLILATIVLFFCAETHLIDGFKDNILDRSGGLLMLLFFALFMAYTLMSVKGQKDTVVQNATRPAMKISASKKQIEKHKAKKPVPMWLSIVFIIGGLGALVIGGQWIVDGASGLAYKAGWSEALVGLTIVAVGSSLPDAATSVMAAIKGETGIAMGNLVGACIFDILFVLGTCAVIHPLDGGTISFMDYMVLAGASILLYIFARFQKEHTIQRWMGAILTFLYIAYVVYLCLETANA